ncbi:rod shape-determining protein [Spirillospora sp. NPDC047279]|uniref:rod shape-determining protein n=1 Tax=Spirillospora sp. NPDC047279 TaxID=3155478 RepID=UPI0033CAC66A
MGDTAIDLGTANTRIYVRGQGLVLDEPSVVAVEGGKVVAAGHAARRMIGQAPAGVSIGRPMRHGAIADFGLADRMLRHFMGQVQRWGRVLRPRVAVAVSANATVVERRAVQDAAYRAGARSVHPIDAPIAAAMGCGLHVEDAAAAMVVDIGAGTTEVAIMSLGGVVVSHTARVGGDAVDRAIASYVRSEHAMLVGDQAAERAKIGLGGVVEISGRYAASGLPGTLALPAEAVAQAMSEAVGGIMTAILDVLEVCPPELAGDLMDRGIALTGGGSLLPGLSDLLRKETELPVQIVDEPHSAVVVGAARHLEGLETFRGVRWRRAALVPVRGRSRAGSPSRG